jgi:hypothetical protein
MALQSGAQASTGTPLCACNQLKSHQNQDTLSGLQKKMLKKFKNKLDWITQNKLFCLKNLKKKTSFVGLQKR